MATNWRWTALAAGLLLTAAACGGGGEEESTAGGDSGQTLKGVTVEVAAKWTGPEQENFLKTVKVFENQTGATVKYASTGEDTDAYLGPRIQGGNPPDVAILPQPGLMQQYVDRDALTPLAADVTQTIDQNYTPYWKELGSVEGKTYGVLVKAAYKSTIWYRTEEFENAGVQPPATWDDLVNKTSATLQEAGATPFVMCGASGWTLTDWFENVYLSVAGPEKYDQLVDHEIPWTDPSVTQALEKLGELWGKQGALAPGALQTDFPSCVTQVFGQQRAAMVYEADFAATAIGDTEAQVGQDAQVFPFPKVGDTQPVTLGGDIAVVMKESEGAQELLKFLATDEAGETWAKLGGYFSPNKNIQPQAYPDQIHQTLAQTILEVGDQARYDLSDMVPSAFGATEGKGMWKDLQDFLRDPKDVKGTQAKLEANAKKAYQS